MGTVAAPGGPRPAPAGVAAETSEPSADGGVLLLAQAWAALGGSVLGTGLRWQGRGGPLVLFALVALPVLAVGSVRAVATRCAAPRDPLWRALGWEAVLTQRRLARFVASGRHDWLRVLGTMAAALARQPATAVGSEAIVAVDTTTTEKRYGPRLAGRRPVYSSVRKRLVDGYALVSACVASPTGGWPLGLLPHEPAPAGERTPRRRRPARPGERPSRLDLALALVALGVTAGVPAATVVGDSAFATMWWLREIAALGRHWLVATRQDRRLRIGAEIRTFRAWVAGVPVVPIATPTGTTVWGHLLPAAILLERHCNRQGLACRAAYFERRDRRGRVRHRWYLVTSQPAWDLAAIWTHWQWRWQIEVLHRDARQHLHLDAFHLRRWAGIVALVACTSLRASLVAFIRAADPTCAAHSTEALVAALRGAACLVTPDATGTACVSPPPTLPAATLWQQPSLPLPHPCWPLRLRAA